MMSRLLDENLRKSYYIFFELSPFADLDFEKNHDISKIITARSFKLGQLIEDDEDINLMKI